VEVPVDEHNRALSAPRYLASRLGRAFLGHLMRFCAEEGYRALARVHEANLGAQVLLRHSGWRCDKVLKNFFPAEQSAYRCRFDA
jgi:hypothetical protein